MGEDQEGGQLRAGDGDGGPRVRPGHHLSPVLGQVVERFVRQQVHRLADLLIDLLVGGFGVGAAFLPLGAEVLLHVLLLKDQQLRQGLIALRVCPGRGQSTQTA